MERHEFPGCRLYDGGRAPSPRRVRIFLAEKGISLPLVPVDMERLGHRSEEIRSRNPLQRLPVLELDDGRVLSETIAICRYFEALCPQPALFGTEPFEQAEIEMWQRRVEFHFLYAVAQAFRHLHPAMAGWEEPQIAEWGEANKPKALEFMRLLDGELATRAHVAGGRFSVADITATVAADFCKPARIAIPAELEHFHRWYAAMRERPSYTA